MKKGKLSAAKVPPKRKTAKKVSGIQVRPPQKEASPVYANRADAELSKITKGRNH